MDDKSSLTFSNQRRAISKSQNLENTFLIGWFLKICKYKIDKEDQEELEAADKSIIVLDTFLINTENITQKLNIKQRKTVKVKEKLRTQRTTKKITKVTENCTHSKLKAMFSIRRELCL